MKKQILVAGLLMALTFLAVAQPHMGRIRVVNSESEPIEEAFVLFKGHLVALTNDAGECEIALGHTDTLVVRYLGYHDFAFQTNQLAADKVVKIELRQRHVALPEVRVQQIKPQALIESAQKHFAGAFARDLWVGKGQYVKAVSQNDRYVGFEQYAGFFASRGVAGSKKEGVYMHFASEHARVANYFQNLDTYKKATVEFRPDYSVDCNSYSWNAAYKAILAYGPQNPNMSKFYSFQLKAVTDSFYVFGFQVNESYFPKKIQIKGRGTMLVSKFDTHVCQLDFEQLNYAHILSKSTVSVNNPMFATSVRLNFSKCGEKLFPHDFQLKRRWIQREWDINQEQFPVPTRLFYNKSKLLELEQFKFDSVAIRCANPMWDGYTIPIIFALLEQNQFVNYEADFWGKQTFGWIQDFEKIKLDLQQTESLEDQFQSKNQKHVMPRAYLTNRIDPNYIDFFYDKWNRKDDLFNQLNANDYEKF